MSSDRFLARRWARVAALFAVSVAAVAFAILAARDESRDAPFLTAGSSGRAEATDDVTTARRADIEVAATPPARDVLAITAEADETLEVEERPDGVVPHGIIRVVDAEGRPLPGGRLYLRCGAFTTRHEIDEAGETEAPIDFEWADVLAIHPERLPVMVPGLRLEDRMTLRLDLGPAIHGCVTVDGSVPDRPLDFEVAVLDAGDLERLYEEWELGGADRRDIGSCRARTDDKGELVVPGDRGTSYRGRLVNLASDLVPRARGDGPGGPDRVTSGRPFRLDLARRP